MNNIKTSKFDKKIAIGALAIMLAALLWSLDGTFIRPKFYELPAGLVVFLEHALGFLVLSPFIYFGWRKIKNLDRKSWGAILWVCVFGGLLGTLMITKAFFAAVHGETTFATVVILQKLQPIFALILARIILKERLKRQFYLWAVLAIVAAYFLAFGKTGLVWSQIDWLHNAAFFAVLAAFSFGSSTVFGKRIVNHLDFKSTAALRFGITTILVLIYILITGDLFKMNQVSGQQWWLLPAIVFSSGAVAMFIYYFGLKRVTASTATIAELFWPFSAVILDYIINKNVLNGIQITAAIVLFICFYQVVRKGKAKQMTFSAKVIRGQGMGRQFGFPTANLDRVDLDIAHGIYLVEAEIESKAYKGLLHFGLKETFNNKLTLELYIRDFIEDISQKQVKVKIVKKIREVKKFSSAEELKAEVKRDIEYLK